MSSGSGSRISNSRQVFSATSISRHTEDGRTMLAISLADLLPRVLAALFVLAAVVSLGGDRRFRELLSRWEYPRGFHVVLGVISLLAALFLALPETRVWGVSLAGFILFGST